MSLSGRLLDTAPVAMALVRADLRIMWVNRAMADLVDVSVADLIDESLLEVVHPEDRDEARAITSQMFAGGAGWLGHEQRWRGHHRPLVVRVHGATAFDPDGDPVLVDGKACAVLQVLDITDATAAAVALQETIGELQRSNEELQRFAYVASHDLKEPLRVVSGHVDLLARRLEGQLDEATRQWMDYIVDGSHRMRDLIDDLLTYSRVETQRREFETFDLGDVAEQVVRAHGTAIDDVDAAVTLGELHRVHGDRRQVSQVLANLMSNSLRYRDTDARPQIAISSRLNDGTVELSVVDNGRGIEPEHRERAFQMFKRLQPRDGHDGTGIGLALCRRIVEGHGGRIWIDDGDDGGVAVRCTLPTAQTTREP